MYAARLSLELLSALSLTLLGVGGLVVETPSPDALCPPLEPTREIVRARLGELEVEGTWRASYVLIHRAKGDFVVLTLRDPEGNVQLQRELPAQGGACATLGQVIALVLERFFLRPEPEPNSEPALLPEASAEVAVATNEPTPLPVRASSATPPRKSMETPQARPEPATQAVLTAGLWASTQWLAPSLGAGLERGPYRLELRLGVDLRDHQTRYGEGSIELRRAPLTLALSREVFARGPLLTSLALELTGFYERASASELTVFSGSGARVVPAAGARLAFDFRVSARRPQPYFELSATLLAKFLSARFMVDGHEVLEPKPWVLGASFGIRMPL